MLDGALIGCGFFARNHLHAWNDLAAENQARLVAVCDADPRKAEAAAAEFSVPRWYVDAAAMFAAERLGWVDVATTMQSHRALCELAAHHRVPAIVQKPMAPTMADCVAMVAAAEAADVALMVHENFRFQRPMLRARAVLDSGAIGEPVWARISFRSGFDVYANQPYFYHEPELIVLDLGIHLADLARFFMGDVAHLSAETQQVRPGVRGEDMATLLVRHVSGAVSVLDMTYESRQLPDPFPQVLLTIEGRAGCLRVFQDYSMQVDTRDGSTTHDVSPKLLPWAERPWHAVQESVRATQAHFVDCLTHGRTPATSGRDNLATFAMVRAAYAAARERRAIVP